MKNIIISGLLGVDAIVFLVFIVSFFLLYGETLQLCKKIKNYYTNSIIVKCILIDQKETNRNYVDRVDGYGGNIRVHYKVERPHFQGRVNGKTYTFVRTKDIRQPICEIGKTYTIYLKKLEHIDCKDFYEGNEIAEMNALIKRKQKQYLGCIGLCVVIAIVLLVML